MVVFRVKTLFFSFNLTLGIFLLLFTLGKLIALAIKTAIG